MSGVSDCRLLATSIEVNIEPVSFVNEDILQIQRQKINQFIKDNHRVWISNVDNLDEAQIICMGETHGNEIHRKINAEIIDSLFVVNSILLVEKASSEPQDVSSLLSANEQAKYVKKPIKIQGWDIEEDDNRTKELTYFVESQMIYEKPQVVHFVNPSKMIALGDNLENNQLSTSSKVMGLFAFFCTTFCIALFIKSCTPCIKKYYERQVRQGVQKIIHDVPVRNQKMCESIEDALKIYEKIFVIGGGNHFDFVEDGEGVEGLDYTPSNKAVENTIKFLATKKFAILIPKFEAEI